MPRKPSHCERVLELLSDGESHNSHELYELGVIAHSRVSDLRRRGFAIEQWNEVDPRTKERTYWYRLISSPVPAEHTAELLRRPSPRVQLDDVSNVFGVTTQSGAEALAERAPVSEGVAAAAVTPGPLEVADSLVAGATGDALPARVLAAGAIGEDAASGAFSPEPLQLSLEAA